MTFFITKKQTGLTLLEVLIALAIVSIALTAVIKAASENIRGTAYLQNKMMAMWAGQLVLNEARVGVLNLPEEEGPHAETTVLLDKKWFWSAWEETSANRRIKHLFVKVSENENKNPIVILETYVYYPE